jgi:hypothetical protein
MKKRPTLGSSGRADARCSPGPKGAVNAAIGIAINQRATPAPARRAPEDLR